MLDIILTLVFSVVMLIFMIFPATKIVDWIESKKEISEKWRNPMLLGVVAILSLFVGLFLKLA
jgi:tellurite resistance protein TehA-like permease